MKKLILFLVALVSVPVIMFADVGIGGAAFYNSPVLLGQAVDINIQNIDQFSFGVDARLKQSLFVVEALVLASVGDFNSCDLYLDAGVNLDVEMFSFMLGAGPNVTYNFGQNPSMQAGLNVKATAEIKIDAISFGTSYIMNLQVDNGIKLATSSGLLGVQILLWLE